MIVNKKVIYKTLCAGAICCILASNVSYADIIACDCTAENLEKLNRAYYSIKTPNKIDEKLSLLTEIECITNKLEGEYSSSAFYNAMNFSNVYSQKKDLKLQKEYLDKAKAIADKIDNNKELLAVYYDSLGGFYANTENFYEAIETLKIADKLAQTESTKIRLATTYVAMKDFKNAEIEYNKLFNLLSENKDTVVEAQLRTLPQKVYFYKDKYDFANAISTYKFVKSMYDKSNKKNAKIEIELNMPLIALYNDIDDVIKLKFMLDRTLSLVLENDIQDKEYFAYGEYLTYYRKINDKKLAKTYLKKKKNLAEKLFQDKNIVGMEMYKNYVEYYDFLGNREKSLLYAQKDVESIKQFKCIAPVKYAIKLADYAIEQSKSADTEGALTTLDEAKEILEKFYPKISFKIFEIENKYGEVYRNAEQLDNAIKHYENALEILDKLQAPVYSEIRDTNKNLADLHFQKGNSDKAMKYIDKAISISTKAYGARHTKTVDALFSKAQMFACLGENDLKNSMIRIIDNIFEVGLVGYPENLVYNYNEFMFNVYIEKNDYNKALKCAETMKAEARDNWQKDNASQKLSQVYKLQNKKLKALKYKVKSVL